jgi:phosphoribosylanthranilate isomerase
MAFLVKICGITNSADAKAATDAGADAIGFNFFNKSRRFIKPAAARRIIEELPDRMLKVGVFVNKSAPDIASIVAEARLNAVQLHGDEPATILSQLPTHVRIVRAYRCTNEGLAPLERYLDECHSLGRMPDAVLIDADAGTAYGGSGELADWTLIREQQAALGGLPLILAGGLNPENVAAAVEAVKPAGVDVSSGVEREPGIKDAQRIEKFIAASREAASRDSL